MAASNAIKAIGTMLRIRQKEKTKQNKTAKKRKNSYLYHLIGSCLPVQIWLLWKQFLAELEFYTLINSEAATRGVL